MPERDGGAGVSHGLSSRRTPPHQEIAVERADRPDRSATSERRPHGTTTGSRERADDDLDLLDLLRIVRRRWPWVLGGVLLVMVGTMVQFRRQVPIYEARTSLRFDVAASPIPGIGLDGMVARNDLATETVALRSFALARDVAQTVHYDVLVTGPVGVSRGTLLDGITTAPGVATGTWRFRRTAASVLVTAPTGRMRSVEPGQSAMLEGLTFRVRPEAEGVPEFTVEVTTLDRAADRLRSAVDVTRPVRDAAVLEVVFRSADVGLTKLVPDVLARRFIDRQTRRRQSGGATTAEFIAEQLDTIETQLAGAEARLRDWREQNRVVQPQAEAGSSVQQRAQYEAELARTTEQLVTIEGVLRGSADMPASVRALPGYRRVLSSSLLAQGQAGTSILSSIEQLEAQRAQMLLTVTENDPQVRLMERTLSDYERQGELFVQNYLATRRAEAAAYERLLGTVGRVLAEVPARELELKTLERDVEVLSSLQLVLRQRLKESEIANASELPTVEVLDVARSPGGPVAPVASRFALFGVGLGLTLGGLLGFVRDRMDRTLHSVADAQRATGVQMVGLIPSFRTRSGSRGRRRGSRASGATAVQRGTLGGAGLIAVREPRHVSSEAYRTLRANLRLGGAGRPVQVLTVSSASPGDGKSTTAANLAVVLAMQGERVLVIDTDMRRGSVHALFGLARDGGTAELLAADGSIEVALSGLVHTVSFPGGVTVDVLSAGSTPENPTELLGGERWVAVLAWARARYDAVLVDTPPINMFADGLLASAETDGVLLVVRAGKSRDDEAEVAAAQVRSLHIPLVGVVLNDYDVKRDGRYGNYRYYRAYYSRYYDHYAEVPGASPA